MSTSYDSPSPLSQVSSSIQKKRTASLVSRSSLLAQPLSKKGASTSSLPLFPSRQVDSTSPKPPQQHSGRLPFLFTQQQPLNQRQQQQQLYLTDFIFTQLLNAYPLNDDEEEEQQQLQEEQQQVEEAETSNINTMSNNHQIDYEHPVVKSFLENVQTALHQTRGTGVDSKVYDSIWLQLGNRDLATVYLTVLLGKLVLIEQRALAKKQSTDLSTDSDVNDDDEEDISVQTIIDTLHLGTHKYDAHHPLLMKRKESIKKRRTKNIVVQADEFKTQEELKRNLLHTSNETNGNYYDSDTFEEDSKTVNNSYSYSTGLNGEKNIFSEKQMRERLYIWNSLAFVSLFYRFDHENPSLLEVVKQWKSTREQLLQQSGSFSDSLGDEIRNAVIPPVEALYKYMQLCTDHDVVGENDTIIRPVLSANDPVTSIACYTYARLQTICRMSRYTENVLADLVVLVRSVSFSQGNLSDSYDAAAMKNIINFIKLLLPQLYVTRESPKMVELSNVLKSFFLEPNPIGNMVYEVLKMIQALQTDPSCLMRERFERSLRKVKISSNSSELADKHRKVHVFYNPYAKRAHYLLDRFDMSTQKKSDDEITFAKANIVLNIFAQSGNKDLIAASQDLYKRVSPENLAKYYYKVSKAATNPTELKQYKDELLKQQVTSSPTYKREESPKIPEVEFEFIALPEEKDISKRERDMKIYPKTGFSEKLFKLIQQVREESGLPNYSEEVLTIEIGVAGGSGTLQHFVHALFLAHKLKILKETKPQVELKVYVIPLGETNYLANWLEKYDGWYSRHVFYPFLSNNTFVPTLKTPNMNREMVSRLNNRIKETIAKKGTAGKTYRPLEAAVVPQYTPPTKYLTPHRMMKTLLSDYCIDGHVSYPVHIYNAQFLCNEVTTITNPNDKSGAQTKQKSSKVIEYVSLSFCQRLDIGVIAEAHQFAKDEKLDGTAIEEILNNKNFKYTGLPLRVSYVPMDPTGEINRSSEINEQPKQYQNISIFSCSSFGDRGSLVCPSQPWLEVFAENTISKKKSKLRDCDIGTNYHVGSITVESTTFQQFSVLLDGELYGPFHKIIINAATNTFNLQTFNNIDIY